MGGLAELISGAISMGIGGFLASQADRDHYRFSRRHTASRVQRSCASQMEREVFAILGPVGIDEQAAQAVAKSLLNVEARSSVDTSLTTSTTDEEKQRPEGNRDVGLTPFFLKFGEGLGTQLLKLYPSRYLTDCAEQRKCPRNGYTYQP